MGTTVLCSTNISNLPQAVPSPCDATVTYSDSAANTVDDHMYQSPLKTNYLSFSGEYCCCQNSLVQVLPLLL